jgi:hypothetical protein
LGVQIPPGAPNNQQLASLPLKLHSPLVSILCTPQALQRVMSVSLSHLQVFVAQQPLEHIQVVPMTGFEDFSPNALAKS